MTPVPRPMLTVPEVAQILRVSRMSVYRLVESGDIRAYRFGRSIRIEPRHLREYLGEALTAADLGGVA